MRISLCLTDEGLAEYDRLLYVVSQPVLLECRQPSLTSLQRFIKYLFFCQIITNIYVSALLKESNDNTWKRKE